MTATWSGTAPLCARGSPPAYPPATPSNRLPHARITPPQPHSAYADQPRTPLWARLASPGQGSRPRPDPPQTPQARESPHAKSTQARISPRARADRSTEISPPTPLRARGSPHAGLTGEGQPLLCLRARGSSLPSARADHPTRRIGKLSSARARITLLAATEADPPLHSPPHARITPAENEPQTKVGLPRHPSGDEHTEHPRDEQRATAQERMTPAWRPPRRTVADPENDGPGPLAASGA